LPETRGVFKQINRVVNFNHKNETQETEIILFEPLQHVQQPMIEKVVEYFLGESPNPCSAENGAAVMKLMDQFTRK